MRTAEETLRKFVTIHTFGDVNATKVSILQAMEEYANECVKAKCTIPVVSGSLPLASGTVTKTREPLPTYHNKCDLCGEIFWTKDAFNNKCPECGREGWQSNDR